MNDFYCLIAGSRTFNDYTTMCRVLNYLLANHLNDNIIIVSGGARGADALAERYANEHHYNLHVIKAEWNKYGKKAGYIRNVMMHDYIYLYTTEDQKCRSCVCFWDGSSKGTYQNFKLAKERNTPLRVWNFEKNVFVTV